MIPAEILNLYTGIKSVGNGVCVGREKDCFLYFKKEMDLGTMTAEGYVVS